MTREEFHSIWDEVAKEVGYVESTDADSVCIHNGADEETIQALIAYGRGDKSGFPAISPPSASTVA